MKKLFDRDSFVLTGMDRTQKKQTLFVILSIVLFFILSAFTFMNFLYCLSDCIGSIVSGSPDVALRDALRSLPVSLSFFMSVSGLMVAHTFYRNESADILQKRAKKHALLGIILGGIIVVYVIIMRIAGKYLSLVEGAPSRLFPLDSIIYSLFFIAFGICILMYLKTAAPAISSGACGWCSDFMDSAVSFTVSSLWTLPTATWPTASHSCSCHSCAACPLPSGNSITTT